jgi:hypothetical protein
MNVSLGKPVLALLSAACIAVPAGTAEASAATGPSVPTASTISTTNFFDPLPQTLSLIGGTGTVAPSVNAPSVNAASVGGATLLAVLTFPYHNVYGVSLAVGNAAAAGLQVVLLPLSVAALVGMNNTDQVPAYVQSTIANAAGAIPGIVEAIQAEIEYDRNLFSQPGSGIASKVSSTTSGAAPRLAAASIGQTANVAAVAQATEPLEADATTAQRDETGTDATAANVGGARAGANTGNSSTADGDTAVSQNSGTPKPVKRLLRKVAEVVSSARGDRAVGHRASGGDSGTPRNDSGKRTSATDAGDAHSTASK